MHQRSGSWQALSSATQVFIAFRVREARAQALALKNALQERGLDAFCSESKDDLKPGQNC